MRRLKITGWVHNTSRYINTAKRCLHRVVYSLVSACELLAQTSPPAPANTEVIARFLETLPEADQAYVMETVRSLCHYLTAIRNNQP
jgi:hypothetical protein